MALRICDGFQQIGNEILCPPWPGIRDRPVLLATLPSEPGGIIWVWRGNEEEAIGALTIEDAHRTARLNRGHSPWELALDRREDVYFDENVSGEYSLDCGGMSIDNVTGCIRVDSGKLGIHMEFRDEEDAHLWLVANGHESPWREVPS